MSDIKKDPYDIVDRMEKSNKRLSITIIDGTSWEVDNSKTKTLKMMAIQKNTKLNEAGKMDEIVRTMLGEDAFAHIEGLDLTFAAWIDIVTAIGAAISREDLEEAEARFPGTGKKRRKSN